MKAESLQFFTTYLEKCGKSLPNYMIQSQEDLYVSLYIAKQLALLGKMEEAYVVLTTVYEEDLFEYDKDLYGSYEEYVEDKVKFLKHLADVNLEVTHDLKKSITYIDEALNLLDGTESVAPYIDVNRIKTIKKEYVDLFLKTSSI